MKTILHEFFNDSHSLLRGVLTLPEWEIGAWIVCVWGFERNATTEKKNKKIADALVDQGVATLRFDFSGCGLSDWDFSTMSIEKQAKELLSAINVLKEHTPIIHLVWHSLGACVIAVALDIIKKNPDKNTQIDKIILLAPALNQKDLLRYWFAQQVARNENPLQKVMRDNYKQFVQEDDFLADCARTDKLTKSSYANPEHYLYNTDKDYSSSFIGRESSVLHVHGERDRTVPVDSMSIQFPNKVIVLWGDHDMEKVPQIEQWLPQAIHFITSLHSQW